MRRSLLSRPAATGALLLCGGLFGALAGAGTYTAYVAKAASYLSDDPAACVNCHIMDEAYDSWAKSAHHARAVCNDCHVPHDSFVHKYYVKAEHGYRHSLRFTLQDFHEPLQITPHSLRVVNDNCARCHGALTHDIRDAHLDRIAGDTGGLDCVRCHAAVAHGALR